MGRGAGLHASKEDSVEVVFWGASGHAKVLNECICRLGHRLIAIFDNRPDLSSPVEGVPLYTGMQGFREWLKLGLTEARFLIAIGGDKGRDRLTLNAELEKSGLRPLSVIHPTAFVAESAVLQDGCQILANASVCVDVQLGAQTIVNTKASIDHECAIGAGVHVAPGATVAGCVRIGDNTLIGAGATVLPRVTIGANVVVGAGSVVTRDFPDNCVAYGNPARVVRMKES